MCTSARPVFVPVQTISRIEPTALFVPFCTRTPFGQISRDSYFRTNSNKRGRLTRASRDFPFRPEKVLGKSGTYGYIACIWNCPFSSIPRVREFGYLRSSNLIRLQNTTSFRFERNDERRRIYAIYALTRCPSFRKYVIRFRNNVY